MDYSTNTLSSDGFLMFIIAIIIGAFIVVAWVLNFLIPFKDERNYIKMEMERCFDEKEYLYWKRKLKNLYLSSIPIIGRFFR